MAKKNPKPVPPAQSDPHSMGPSVESRGQVDPWPIEPVSTDTKGCECHRPTPVPQSEPAPPREPIGSRNDECCRQILELLRCLFPDQERCFKPKKPKTPVKVKAANLCQALPIKLRTVPAMMLVLRRHRDGVQPGNAFEADMKAFLDGRPPQHLDVLRRALAAYDALPAGTKDCLYDTRFDNWPDETPLDPVFFGKNTALELIALGRTVRHGPGAGLTPTPGKVRFWEQSFELPSGEPGKSFKLVGPWPYICAINPSAGEGDGESFWFKNRSATYPDLLPLGELAPQTEAFLKTQPATNPKVVQLKFDPQEFDWDCKPINPPNSTSLGIECVPGGLTIAGFTSACLHGIDYEVKDNGNQMCLRVPAAHLGTEVGLRGFNFFSLNAKVRVRHMEGGQLSTKFESQFPGGLMLDINDVHGDPKEPPTSRANCTVRDTIFFTFPARVDDGQGNDVLLPGGIYRIEVVVPNEISFAPTAGQPAPQNFVSNGLLIEMIPPTNFDYAVNCDSAFCEKETSGLGADEAWFRSYSVVADLPKHGRPVSFSWTKSNDIFDQGDVDSGEWISINGDRSLFGGKIGRDQVMAIAVVGFEVDDRGLAKDQIRGVEEAFFEFFERWFGVLGTSGEGGAIGAAIQATISGAATATAWTLAAGFGAMLLITAASVWAQWERADIIAYDFIVMTSLDFFKLTELDPSQVRLPSSSLIRGLGPVRIDTEPLPKERAPGGQVMIYREAHTYHSLVEDSRYRLVYSFTRTS